MRRLIVTSILVLPLVDVARAQDKPRFSAIHGAPAAKYQQWLDGLDKQNLRPDSVSVVTIKGEPTYAAIAVVNKAGQAWAAARDLDSQAYQREFNAQVAKGLLPICVVSYRKGDVLNYAAIFLKHQPVNWAARHDMDANKNQLEFTALTKLGFRPAQGSVCEDKDGVRFAYVYVKDNVANWLCQSGLTADQFQRLIDDAAKKNMVPVSASAYGTKNGTRFAVIIAEDAQKRAWSARHDLTPKQYQEYFDEMTGKGFQPIQICAYPWQDEVRYLAVFVKE